MDDNLKLIMREFHELKGQFVITDEWKIERLIAIGQDSMDYYYVTYDGRKLTFNTCVGRIIPLKGKIDEGHYLELIRIAQLNHYDQITLWNGEDTEHRRLQIQEHKMNVTAMKGSDRFLTELFWDLN